jgi:hypothetical protein
MGSLGISDSWHHKDVPGPAAVTAGPRDPTPVTAVRPTPGRHILAAIPDCSLVKVRLERRADIRDTGRARVTSEGRYYEAARDCQGSRSMFLDRSAFGRPAPLGTRGDRQDSSGDRRRTEALQASAGLAKGRSGGQDIVDQQNVEIGKRPPRPAPARPQTPLAASTRGLAAARNRPPVRKRLQNRHLQHPGDFSGNLCGMIDASVPHPPSGPRNGDHDRRDGVRGDLASHHLRKALPKILRQFGPPPVLQIEDLSAEVAGELTQANHAVGDAGPGPAGHARR